MARKFLRRSRKRVSLRRKKGSWLTRKYSVAQLAKGAWKGVKYIKSLINVEKKFHDVSASTTISTTPSIVNLSNIATGDDYKTRDGNSILLQSLQWRINLYANTTDGASFVRVIVFRDNDQRGTDPTAADLLETTTAGLSIVSPLLHYVNRRFAVLSDKVYTLSDTGSNWLRHIKKFMKMPSGTHIKYSADAGADASNWEGALYVLFVSNNGTNLPTMDYYFRLRYTDN